MRNILGLLALGAGAYVIWRRTGAGETRGGNAAFASDQAEGGVRDAGPAAMRDPVNRPWSEVDEQSDQSFPASDPPANY